MWSRLCSFCRELRIWEIKTRSLSSERLYLEADGDHVADAVGWLTKAVEQGLTSAKNFLGACYYHGIGAEQNFTEALRLQAAAEDADTVAQYNVARIYLLVVGVPADHNLYVHCLELSAGH